MYNEHVGDFMKSILVEITCPTCLWHTHKPSDTLVIPEFEPDLKEQLDTDTYFTFICPRCGTQIAFFHTCVYPDKTHNFILLMKPVKEQKIADHLLYADMQAIKRYITKPQEIAEKIRILEAQMDDRVLEIVKVKLYLHLRKQGRNPVKLAYKDYDKASETIWFTFFENGCEDVLAVTMATYEQIKKQLPKEDHDHFQEVNLQWAANYLSVKNN